MRDDRGQDRAVVGQVVERGRHELQQALRHPPLEIEEQQVLHERLVRRDLARQHSQERPRDLGVRGQEVQEQLPVERPHVGVLEGHAGSGSGHPPQHAELAEELRPLERGVQLSMAGHRERGDLDSAVHQEVHAGRVVALVEQVGAAAVPADGPLPGEVANRLVVDRCEDGRGAHRPLERLDRAPSVRHVRRSVALATECPPDGSALHASSRRRNPSPKRRRGPGGGFHDSGPANGKIFGCAAGLQLLELLRLLERDASRRLLVSLFSALAAVGALGVTFLSAICVTSSSGPGSVEPFTSMAES